MTHLFTLIVNHPLSHPSPDPNAADERPFYSVWFLDRRAPKGGRYEDEERQFESAASLTGKSVQGFCDAMRDKSTPLVESLTVEEADRLETALRAVGIDSVTLVGGAFPQRFEEVPKKNRSALHIETYSCHRHCYCIKHIHTTTLKKLQARTIHRDLWENVGGLPLRIVQQRPPGPQRARNPFLRAFFGVFLGYFFFPSCLLGPILIPVFLWWMRPQTRRAQRPLFNLGWDIFHNVVARVAAVVPEAKCDVYHHTEGKSDFAWALDTATGLGEEFAFDLEVLRGEGKSLDAQLAVRWKGIKLRQPEIEELKRAWWDLLSNEPLFIEQSEQGLFINGKVNTSQRDDTAERVGRWFSRLMLLTRHRTALEVGDVGPRAQLNVAGGPPSIDGLCAEMSTRLKPSHSPVARVSVEEHRLELGKYIFIQHGVAVGLFCAVLISSIAMALEVIEEGPTIFLLFIAAMQIPPLFGFVWWFSFSCFGWTKRPSEEEVVLELRGQTLATDRAAIDLSRPFETRFMRLHGRRDTVAVELVQSKTTGGVNQIRFLVPVEASLEVAALPELDQRAGWLSCGALIEWVWPTLMAYSNIHGQPLRWDFSKAAVGVVEEHRKVAKQEVQRMALSEANPRRSQRR